jgi:N-acetylneuraminic acid mutarotase
MPTHKYIKRALFLVSLSGILLLDACKKEEEIRAPKIETLDATLVGSLGATFNGNVTDIGTSGVKEAGFLYGTSSDLSFENSLKIAFGALTKAGPITVANDDYFTPNQTFFVKAYAMPANGTATVFGFPVSFIGKGGIGKPPVITDFNPKEAKIGQSVTIDGQNFGTDMARVKVLFQGKELEITSTAATRIIAKIPANMGLSDISGPLTINVGQHVIMTGPLFHFLYPWKRLADFPGNIRYGAVSFVLNGVGYVGLGEKLGAPQPYAGDVWKYDVSSDTWTEVKFYGANATGLSYLNQSAFVLGNKAYVGLGRSLSSSGNATLSTFSVYDPTANSWSASGWTNGATFDGAIASSVNGKGYVIGGLGSANGVLEYDPNGNSWTPKTSAPLGANPRYKASSFTIGNDIYLATGAASDVSSLTDDLWAFSTTGNSWSQKASLPSTARWQATAFSINNIGYLIGGGLIGGPYSSEVWSYSPANNQWTKLSPDYPGGAVLGSFVFVLNNKAYIGTGANLPSGGRKKDVWVFDPSLL